MNIVVLLKKDERINNYNVAVNRTTVSKKGEFHP